MLICLNCGQRLEINDLDFDEHDKPKYCPECGCHDFDFEYDEPSRAERRKNSYFKAKRKRNICLRKDGSDWYDNLHQYADNKIHCSCPMCRAKTAKTKLQTYGPAGKNWTIADKKKIQELENQLDEYQILENEE